LLKSGYVVALPVVNELSAQWLQSEAGLTVGEVSYRVGFSDPAYFTRCFTKQFGQSPKLFAATYKSATVDKLL